MSSDVPGELVVGVAGHIDHGKTALVKALTGVDTDRLPEEKARGITIELGFARLTLPGGRRAAVIDMPGHERFVRAMIAGAGGVDLALLVVAVNEGVMPQTREHLAIATLLGVRGGVVALSKADLASPELRELAEEEVREALVGTALEGAPIVSVSAHTGEGLEALRVALSRVAVPPRESSGPALLPIDRVFLRKGFGVVLTGTLVSGVVREGDALAVAPVGPEHEALSVRVRGLQVHGEEVREARAGTRLAVNVAGVELAQVPRGAWLLAPDAVALTHAFDAQVTLLPATHAPASRRFRAELAVGAAHSECVLSLLEGERFEPGRAALARVTAEVPVALRPGERFVLRGPPSMAAVGSTLGGGVVVRPVAERARKREVAFERASEALRSQDDARARAEQEAETAGYKGLAARELAARTGIAHTPEALREAGLRHVAGERWVARRVLEGLGQRVLQALSAHHGAHPASRGLERRALVSLCDDALLDAALEHLLREKKLERGGELLWRAGWKPRDPDAVPHLPALAAALEKAGLQAPSVKELAAAEKVEPRALEPALKRLVERGDAVKIHAELYVHAPVMKDLEARLRAWLAQKGSIDAQGFKELTGASRKWTIPLAEYFDAARVTLRVGDVRKLRG